MRAAQIRAVKKEVNKNLAKQSLHIMVSDGLETVSQNMRGFSMKKEVKHTVLCADHVLNRTNKTE